MTKSITAFFSVLVAAMLSSITAFAQSADTWTGSTDANWGTSANWTFSSGSGPVANGDSLFFGAVGSSGTSLNNDLSGLSVAGLTINSGAAGFTFGGNALTITGGLTNNSSATETINLILGGAGVVVNSGNGTLTLSAANTFGAGLIVSNGTVNLNSSSVSGAGAAGTGTITLAGGLIQNTSASGVTISNNIVAQAGTTSTIRMNGQDVNLFGNISGSGNLIGAYTGSGTHQISLNGDDSGFSGTCTVNNNSTIRFRFNSATAGSANAAWVLNNNGTDGQSLGFGNGTIYFGSLSGNGQFRQDSSGATPVLVVGGLNTDATWGGRILLGSSCHAAVTKVGTGAWTLTGANGYDKTTTVENGTLIAGAAGTIPAAIALGDATSVTNATAMHPQLFNGAAITTTPAITVGTTDAPANPSATFTLGGNTANNSAFSGAISLNQSLIVTQAVGGTLTLSGGITNATANALTVTFNTAGSITNTAAIGNGSAGGTIALIENGSGTLALSAANTYTGNTTVNGGTLLVNGSTASGAVSVSGSGSVLGGSGTIGGNTTINNSAALTPAAGTGSATTLTFGGNLTLANASANFILSPSSLTANDRVNYGSAGTLTLDNSDTINITCPSGLGISGDYTLFTSSGGTVTMTTTPTLKTNGITVVPGLNTFIITNIGSSVVLHYAQAATPPTINSATASPASIGHYQTTAITVNVTPAGGQSVTNVNILVDGLAGAGDPINLTGPGGNGAGNWTGTFTASGTISAGSYNVSGLVKQNDGATAGWLVSVTVTNYNNVWNGGGSDNKWSTGGNWSASYAPGAGDIVALDGTVQTTNNLDFNLNAGSLTFNSGAGSFDITNAANTLTLLGDVTNNSANPQTLDVPVALSGSRAINAASGNITINGAISGSGAGLTVSGNGTTTVALGGANSYTGDTTVNANSILQLQNANALAGSTLTLNSGSKLKLRANADTTYTTPGITSLPNSATVTFDADQINTGGGNGSHTLTLTNSFGMGADATINVTAGSSDTVALGTVNIAAGNAHTETLNATAGATANLGGVTASGVYDYFGFSGDGNINVVGPMQETANSRWLGLTFNQTGTVTLWAANSLRFNNGGSSGNPGYSPTVSFNSGVTVLNNSDALNMNSYFGSIIRLGSPGNGDATVLLGGTNGFDGGITMNPPLMVGGSSWPYYNGSIYAEYSGGILRVGGQNTNGVNTWGCNFTLGPADYNDLVDGYGITLVAATGGEVDFTGKLLANGSDTSAGIIVGDATYGGTVKITGVNTYLGGTIVNNGTLSINSDLTGTTATGALTVNDGSTLKITEVNTNQLTPSNLTVGSGSGATLEFANVGSAIAPLNPSALNINGTMTINVSSLVSLTTGTYPLVTNYTGGTVTLGTLPKNVNAHVDTSGNQISLVVDSIAVDVWGKTGGGNWDTTTANWKTNGAFKIYSDGELVRFDDTPGDSSVAVTNTVAVSPLTVVVTNNTVAYTISGSPIAGTASLTKSGSGTFALANTNTYTGGTFINNGTLQLGDGAVNNGVVAGGITDNGNLSFANPQDQTFSAVISGTGSVTKTAAAGVLTLSGNNTYSGGTTLNAGSTTKLPNGAISAFGIGTLTLNNATLIVQPGSGGSYNSVNSCFISNNVVIPSGTTSVIDNSANNYGNLWVGSDGVQWTGTGTIKFQNSSTVTAPAVLWNANPLQNFQGTINIGATGSGSRMFNGIAYNASSGGGIGTSVSTFDASGAAWQLGDVGYSATQVQDPNCTTVKFGSISATNTSTSIKGNGSTACTFEVGALGTSTTYAGSIEDRGSAATHLTKVGAGTLTLTGTNSYTGNTTINGGTLELAQSFATLATNSTVTIASSAHLKLTASGVINVVNGLVTNGVAAGNGLYNSANSSGYITGSGSLQIGPAVAPTSEPISTSYNPGTKQLTLSWTEAGWTLESQTNNTATGLSPSGWTPVSGATSPYVITVDPSQPTVFYRLTYP